MEPVPFSMRIPNIDRSPGPDEVALCSWCGDEGALPVLLRKPVAAHVPGSKEPKPPVEGEMYEEMGPCPYCQRGFRREFSGVYGDLGYWQGKEPVQITQLYPSGTKVLPRAEQVAAMRALVGKLGVVVKDVEANRVT